MLGFMKSGQLYRDAETVYLRLGLELGLELMSPALAGRLFTN